ncbi:MAG: hypothetical protein ACYCXA_06715 [Actinomycetes bacterium]
MHSSRCSSTSGFVAIPGITTAAWTGHLAFAHDCFDPGFSVAARTYLIILITVGDLFLSWDSGSRLNELFRDS